MKEKIEKFFHKGGALLIGCLFNVAIIVWLLIDCIIDKSWIGCVCVLLVYLPWTGLFLLGYLHRRYELDSEEIIRLYRKTTALLLDDLKRYKEHYGELPPEEETKRKEKTKEE